MLGFGEENDEVNELLPQIGAILAGRRTYNVGAVEKRPQFRQGADEVHGAGARDAAGAGDQPPLRVRRMRPAEAAAGQREVTLTTIGRKTGKPRRVIIWIAT